MGKKRTVNKGDIFGRLEIVEESSPQHYFKKSGKPYVKRVFTVKCNCDLGTVFDVQLNHLVTGKTLGCGCVRLERLDTNGLDYFRTKHGMSGEPTYLSWEAMRNRCGNPKYAEWYSDVAVCDRWADSFENFLEDMGVRPEGCTLNRINSSKIYSKETCEWATLSMQSFDTKRKSTNKSGRTGVFYVKESGKWRATIGYQNKHIHLGDFTDKADAIAARENAEIRYYGFTKE